MGTCKTCKHWELWSDDGIGVCKRLSSLTKQDLFCVNVVRCSEDCVTRFDDIDTGANFGCVLHVSQNSNSHEEVSK